MSNINSLIKDFLGNLSSTEENLFPYLANSGKFTPGETPVYYSGPYWTNDEIEVI